MLRNTLSFTLSAIILVAPWVCFGSGIFILTYLVIAGICMFSFHSKQSGSIALSDCFVMVYLVYGLLNLIFVRSVSPDTMMIWRWLLFAGIYFAIRRIENKQFVLWSILFSGLLQVCVGLVQFCGLVHSHHRDFLVTGTFPNPGPLGGYLAFSFIAAVWLLHNQRKYKVFLWSALLMVLAVLIVVDSRAAWITGAIGVMVQFPLFRKKWVKLSAIAGIVIMMVGLYFYRPGSADARLLIWRVCTQLVESSPVVGTGVGTLPQYYMGAQADFFITNPDSEFIAVSNNNYQAFNEFIHLAVEQGVVGLALFLGILLICRKSIYFPLVLGWCVFACFSYPADLPALMIILVAGVALCTSPAIIQFNLNRKWFLGILIILPFLVMTHVKYNRAFKNVDSATVAVFPANMEYMLRFAAARSDVAVFKEVTGNICSSTELLCDMGDIYKKNGDTVHADSCYQLAHHMVPCRIVPLHKLYLLYHQVDSLKAKDYATRIINFQSPVVGSAVLRARADAKFFLNNE